MLDCQTAVALGVADCPISTGDWRHSLLAGPPALPCCSLQSASQGDANIQGRQQGGTRPAGDHQPAAHAGGSGGLEGRLDGLLAEQLVLLLLVRTLWRLGVLTALCTHPTPQHDNKAVKSGGFACHARCDEVMRRLAQRLGLVVPRYVRRDAVVVGHQQHSSSSGDGGWAAGHAAGGRGTAAVAPTSNKEASEPAANKEGSRSAAAAAAEAAPAAVKREESGRGDESGSTARGDSSTSSSSSSSSEEDEGRAVAIPFSVFVQSSHGPKCLMPMVQSVDFAFDVSGWGRTVQQSGVCVS